MSRERSAGGVVLLVVVTAGLTFGLHQLGTVPGMAIDFSNTITWLQASAPEFAIAAVLRHIGLALGYWVLATTGLYLLAGIKSRRRPTWVRLITLPFVRRAVDRTLATALAATIVATPLGPAVADEPPPPPAVYEVTDDGIPVPHVRPPSTTENPPAEVAGNEAPVTTEAPSNESPVTRPIPSPVAPTAPPTAATISAERVYTVQPGDNLWSIAESHVSAADEVAAYWRELVELNRPTLRSGDANLIYPGEAVALPEIGDSP